MKINLNNRQKKALIKIFVLKIILSAALVSCRNDTLPTITRSGSEAVSGSKESQNNDSNAKASFEGQACFDSNNLLEKTAQIRHLPQQILLNTLNHVFSGLNLSGVGDEFSSFESSPEELGAGSSAISDTKVSDIIKISEKVEQFVVSRSKNLTDCDDSSAAEKKLSCVSSFVKKNGRILFRRSLEKAEIDSYVKSFKDDNASKTFGEKLGLVARRLVNDPSFVYIIETGGPADKNGVRKLTDLELISRISHMLTRRNPSSTMIDIAEANRLTRPRTGTEEEAIANFVRQIIDKDKGGLADFFMRWSTMQKVEKTGLEKDSDKFPLWNNSSTPKDLMKQTKAFFDYLIDQDATFEDLYTTAKAPINARTSSFYQLTNEKLDSKFRIVDLDQKIYNGVLGLPGILAVINNKHSEQSEIYNGKWLRERVFCEELQFPAMANVDQSVDRRENPSCWGCHQFMDDIGLSMYQFNSVGKFVSADLPAAFKGEFKSISSDEAFKFSDLDTLSKNIVSSDLAKTCLSKQMFRYAINRTESKTDSCDIDNMVSLLEKNSYKLKDLPVALSLSRAFRYIRY